MYRETHDGANWNFFCKVFMDAAEKILILLMFVIDVFDFAFRI
jgi:hypothetical protein